MFLFLSLNFARTLPLRPTLKIRQGFRSCIFWPFLQNVANAKSEQRDSHAFSFRIFFSDFNVKQIEKLVILKYPHFTILAFQCKYSKLFKCK